MNQTNETNQLVTHSTEGTEDGQTARLEGGETRVKSETRETRFAQDLRFPRLAYFAPVMRLRAVALQRAGASRLRHDCEPHRAHQAQFRDGESHMDLHFVLAGLPAAGRWN